MNTKSRTLVDRGIGIVAVAILFASCGGRGVGPGDQLIDTPSGTGVQSANPATLSAAGIGPTTLWADTAVDAAGNLYSVGYLQDDTGGGKIFDLGNAVTLTTSGFRTPVVIKRNAAGVVQSVKALPSDCVLETLALDGGGNLIIAGSVFRKTGVTLDFGDGVTLAAPGWIYDFTIQYTLILKMEPTGKTLWAVADLAGGGTSGQNSFVDLDVDSSGNAYAAGYISGTDVAGLINGDVIDGTNSRGSMVLVKYSPEGVALWGRAPSGSSGYSNFKAVQADANGDVYLIAAYGDGACRPSPAVSAPQTISQETNHALVKYSSAGTALWAQTLAAFDQGTDTTWAKATFTGLDLDSAGNPFVCANVTDDIVYHFGNGVSVKGRSRDSQETMAVIRYAADGTAQWASGVQTGTSKSNAVALSVDGTGNAYVGGFVTTVDILGWGNGVTVRGSATFADNPLLVKFDPTGKALWAKTQISGSTGGVFRQVLLSPSGKTLVIGNLSAGDHGFGNGVTVATADNQVIVTYQE